MLTGAKRFHDETFNPMSAAVIHALMQFWYLNLLYISTGNKSKGITEMGLYDMSLNAYRDMFLARNMNFLAASNPMLYGIVTPNSIYNNNNSIDRNAFDCGVKTASISKAQIDIQYCGKDLAALSANLKEALRTEGLSEDQKERIQELLDRVTQAQERLLGITKELSKGADVMTALNSIKQLEKDIADLAAEREKLFETLTQEVENDTESDDSTDEAGDAAGSDGKTRKTKGKYDKNGRPKSLTPLEKNEAKNICLDFSDSIDGWWGTDNDLFEKTIDKLDANNIVEVMKHWKDNYCDGKVYDDKSFVDSFVWDADHGQKAKYGRKILAALVERAEANGLDVSELEAAARKELNSVFISNDTVEEKLTAIYDKIEKQEKANKSTVVEENEEAKDKNKVKKAEEEKKKAEKIQQQKSQFIEDMKQCLERDDIKELPQGVEVVKDGKGNFKGFKIRIKGKDYFGKDYLALVAALAKANLTLPVPAKKEQAA